jgi:WD40 repeat protein
MPGLPASRPAPELPAGVRSALVIATSRYDDPEFRQLRSPGLDAAEFAEAIADPGIGGFTVTQVIDEPEARVRRTVARFCASRGLDDLILIYLSCHGVLDNRGRLFFVTSDTEKQHLGATAVSSEWLLGQLDECRARRQVLILDCCFSGAFAGTAKGDDDLKERLESGRGRTVLTASRAREYSHEGTPLPGMATAGSVFTTGLINGLRTGEADIDHDGFITLDDAFRHAADYVREHGSQQTPQRWLYGAEGAIVIARNPAGVVVTAAPLPEALRASLDSPYPRVRIGAVNTLAEWLTDKDPSRVLAAEQALHHVAETDAPAVAAVARGHLAAANPPARAEPVPEPEADAGPATEPEPETEPEARPEAETLPEPGPGHAPELGPEAGPPRAPEQEPGALLRTPGGLVIENPGPSLLEAAERLRPPQPAGLPPDLAAGTPRPHRPARQPWRRLIPRTRRARAVSASLLIVVAASALLAPNLDLSPGSGTHSGGSSSSSSESWGYTATGLAGHTKAVTQAAFSPDGQLLATNGDDDTIRLYSVATGKPAGNPISPGGYVQFSPDSKYLAIMGEGPGRLWDVASGKVTKTLTGYQGLTIMAFSPDGHTLAVAGTLAADPFDNPIHLVNVATGAELGRLSGPECGVQSLAFSPDGKTLAASICGNPLTVRIWDMATRKGTHVLTRAGYPLVFSHDGTRIATGHSGSKDDKIQLWNVTTGQPTLSLAAGAESYPAAFNPTDGTLATIDKSGNAALWNNAGQQLVTFAKGAPVAFSPDGTYLALTDGSHGDVLLWNTRTRQKIPLSGSPGTTISDLELSRDAHYLAAASADKKTWLWHFSTWPPRS